MRSGRPVRSTQEEAMFPAIVTTKSAAFLPVAGGRPVRGGYAR
ncbi:hypothetical protein SAMN04487847_2422 [Microbacterium sp. cf332]|nr:hypothetical protein SAMN04487847_2422 [Microbacterium sp. cf332]